MTQAQRRVGIFGGAFDPPHRAHLALARAAVEQLQLDELRVLPTGQAWHKSRLLSAAEHRLAMARLAFDDLPRVVVDDRELRRPGASYTIDTLRELAGEQPDAHWFLVIGQDQAAAFTAWKDWEAIAAMATICVAQRPAQGPGAVQPAQAGLPPQAHVWVLQMPAMSESATELRARVAAGDTIDHLVPPAVARYIDLHSLYKTP